MLKPSAKHDNNVTIQTKQSQVINPIIMSLSQRDSAHWKKKNGKSLTMHEIRNYVVTTPSVYSRNL